MSSAGHTLHVVIAGAGLAGLAAARDLERRGARVTVIEARDRVGGRTWTIRDGFGGQHAEAGADMIEEEQEDLLALAASLGLKTRRILRHGFGFYGLSPDGTTAMQKMDAGLGQLMQPFVEAVREYGLSDQRWDTAIAHELSGHSVAEWLTRNGASEWVRARFKGFRGLFLADPEDLSALAVVEFFAEAGTPAASKLFRIVEGNDAVAQRIAAGLRDPVRLSTIVRRVQRDENGVTVSVEDAFGISAIVADYVIVAVPASTAREIVFEPALPERQEEALRALRYGAATRLLLQFDDRFWNKAGQPTAFGTDGPLGALWDANEQQRGAAILLLLAGGNASRALQSIAGEDAAAIVPHLQWLGRPGRLLNSRMVVWETDPWARGGYAYFHAGFDPRLRDLLARPAGRIVFAGEHTSHRWQGYMNGAVVSGYRAAAEVAALARR
jgi:monoamine oxidase